MVMIIMMVMMMMISLVTFLTSIVRVFDTKVKPGSSELHIGPLLCDNYIYILPIDFKILGRKPRKEGHWGRR